MIFNLSLFCLSIIQTNRPNRNDGFGRQRSEIESHFRLEVGWLFVWFFSSELTPIPIMIREQVAAKKKFKEKNLFFIKKARRVVFVVFVCSKRERERS